MDEGEKLIRLPEVLRVIGCGKSHIYKLISTGRFPAPLRIGRVRAWRVSDVQRFINELPSTR